MSNYLKIGGLLLVGTLVGLLIRSGAPSTIEVKIPEPDLSGVYSLSNKNFAQGIKVGTNDQFQVSSTGAVTTSDDITVGNDLTVSGGALTVTTAASATSTLVIGEIETYATSSATKVCLKFSTVSTSSLPANNGFVLWAYGACP